MKSSRRLAGLSFATALILGALWAPNAQADFGIAKWDGLATANQAATPFTQSGGHPYEIESTIKVNSHVSKTDAEAVVPDSSPKDILADIPPGLVGNPTVLTECTAQQLAEIGPSGEEGNACPIASQVGDVYVGLGDGTIVEPLYNMVPPRGVPARFGFDVVDVEVVLDGAVRGEGSSFHLGVDSRNISNVLPITGARVVFWGVPADPSHDGDRCSGGAISVIIGLGGTSPNLCDGSRTKGSLSNPEPLPQDLPHSAGVPPVPFLTMPTSCTVPGTGLEFDVSTDSWLEPGAQNSDGSPLLSDPAWQIASFFTHEPAPNETVQLGTEHCYRVPSDPALTLQPTAHSAESPTGLNVDLKVPSEGLLNPEGIAQSTLKKVSVTLPEGMSINPSQAEGLGVCTLAEYEAETATSEPGEECPSTAKIGTVQITTPLLEEPIPGVLYVAKQHDNPFNSLLALYIVAKSPTYGVVIKSAGKVEPNPVTGQLTTTFDNLPQAPFSDFQLSFREGQRSPLSTPPACGHYTATARFTPWSDPATTITTEPSFDVTSGVAGGPCPTGGVPPFHPQLLAGTTNNAAGRFSPFYTRISRTDGEQEITHFSIKLPPGLAGILAGIPACPEAAIAAAKAREHEGGGSEEQQSPSCSPASEVGHSLVGSGVGSVLAYAPGKIYLAGPYHGAPISLVSITAAKVGPFDLGTVVVRFALRIDPDTAEVFVDSTGSDPIPHIIDGIPVHLREIRAYVDRPGFIFNPTSCERTSTASTVLGSGLDFVSAADDVPLTISSPFQSADCAALPFKPKLKLSLKGNMKRTGAPAFRAELTMKPGEANIARSLVTLPRSELLYNAHIQNACGIGSFRKTGSCPPDSVYGRVMAISPVFDEPLEGPVYLMGGLGHKLPDLYGVLKNAQAEIHLDGIVSGLQRKRHGEAFSLIRNAFEALPDAPVSKFVLEMDGGPKGLLQNGTNLCADTHRAISEFSAHSGKVYDTKPVVVATGCAGKDRKAKQPRRHAR